MKKKDIFSWCICIMILIIAGIYAKIKLPCIIIGIIAFIVAIWANSKEEEQIIKRTMDELKKDDDNE